MNLAVAWMQRIAQIFDGQSSLALDLTQQLSVYVSGSVVALAYGRMPKRPQEEWVVAMRADPVRQISAIAPVLSAQLTALGLQRDAVRQNVSLVLAPEMYTLSLVDRPDVADADLVEAVRWQIQDQVDFPMESASVDVFELPRSASRERRMVFAVSVQKDLLKALLQQCSQAGLRVTSIDASELALRNLAWQCYPQPDQNIALLRLTSNSGLINISRADELYLARRISGMPSEFSESMWEGFRERLLLQVQRSIDYYESAMNQPHCNMLVVACTSDWTNRVTDYLGEMLPIPVRTLDEVLAGELHFELFNPEKVDVDWTALDTDSRNALAAGLPAIGGLLRHHIAATVAQAA